MRSLPDADPLAVALLVRALSLSMPSKVHQDHHQGPSDRRRPLGGGGPKRLPVVVAQLHVGTTAAGWPNQFRLLHQGSRREFGPNLLAIGARHFPQCSSIVEIQACESRKRAYEPPGPTTTTENVCADTIRTYAGWIHLIGHPCPSFWPVPELCQNYLYGRGCPSAGGRTRMAAWYREWGGSKRTIMGEIH